MNLTYYIFNKLKLQNYEKKSCVCIVCPRFGCGFSQVSWNAKVGMNISNFTGDFDMNAKVGFKIGGGMEYGFNEIWSLQPSLFVSSKGAKKDELSVNAVLSGTAGYGCCAFQSSR